MALLAALCLFACAAHSAPVSAPTVNVSYTVWTVSQSTVLLKFLLPAPVAQSLTGAEVPLLTSRKLGEYILQHVDVEAGGRACPAIDQGYDLGKVDPLAVGADMYGFEILFRCPTTTGLVLHDHAIFAGFPGHIDFARIEMNGRSVQQIFTAGRQRLAVGAELQPAGFGSYLRLGLRHLSFGIDRLCFLLGSLLLIRRRREAVYAYAALVAGYLASLLVGAPGWIVPRPLLLESFMGLMVALLAALITLRELKRPRVAVLGCPALMAALALATAFTHAQWAALALCGGAAAFAWGLLAVSESVAPTVSFAQTPSSAQSAPLAPTASARPTGSPARARSLAHGWLLTLAVVGFLDGFALPSALEPLNLPVRSELWMTAAFDLGAAALAALVLGLPLGVFALLRTRATRLNPRALVNELAAACLGGLGTFWLVSRLYG